MFGSPTGGISKRVFKRSCMGLGINLSDESVDAFYDKYVRRRAGGREGGHAPFDAELRRYNKNHSGMLSFHDLVAGVMPAVGGLAGACMRRGALTRAQDYTGTPWNIKRDADMEATAAEKLSRPPVLLSWPRAMAKNKPNIEEVRWPLRGGRRWGRDSDAVHSQIERILREKILAHTRRANDQYREGARAPARGGDAAGSFERRAHSVRVVRVPQRRHLQGYDDRKAC